MPATKGESKTVQFRTWDGGMQRTASRTAMKDSEAYLLDNVQPIGPGQLQTLPTVGSSIATIPAGIARMKGVQVNIAGTETPLLITSNTDGSMSQVNPSTGVVTTICAAGVMTASAKARMWQDTPVLLGDPSKGYAKWDGTTFTILDGTKVMNDFEVFESRVWYRPTASPRTVSFGAPDSYTDFSGASGGGSTGITDNIFTGSITRFLSALELLWVVGPGAVNAISNVQTSAGVTTFSNTNIVANVGSAFPSSVASFFRTFLFLTPYGVYAIVGATPQKLSDALDGLFPSLVFGTDHPAAVFSLNNVFVWAVLVTYADPTAGNRPVLLCFSRGVWFLATQGASTTWITSLVTSNGTPQCWATDGTTIYQCFAGGTAVSAFTFQTKLWDFGAFTQAKQLLRLGLEFSSSDSIAASITLENEAGSAAAALAITPSVTVTWTGGGGAAVTWTGGGGATVTWTASGLVQARGAVDFAGDYLGVTVSGTSAPFTIAALAMEIKPTGEWV